MNQNHFPDNSISHKDLNAFLLKAKKDISLYNSPEDNKSNVEQDFTDLIKNWIITSQKILLIMNSKEKVFTNNRDPKSLMAFGAVGVHINMALQALKATGSNQ